MRSILVSLAALAAFSLPAAAEEAATKTEAASLQPIVLQPQRANWENKSDRIDVVPVSTEPDQNNFAAEGAYQEDTKR